MRQTCLGGSGSQDSWKWRHLTLALSSVAINLILVAFITGNSSLEPLTEGLYDQIHVNLR